MEHKSSGINKNSQELLRKTEAKGTDASSYIWILKCRRCSHIYGCNSTDHWERKCPKCQNGKPGLETPTEQDGKDWTREEHIIAFNLYNQIPFGTIHMRNPKVIELAALLGRKVGSVSNKLANLARYDPALQARGIRGLTHGAKGEKQTWDEFATRPETLAYESARLLAQRLDKPIEQIADVEETELPKEGRERETVMRVRINQSFFRSRILSAYNYRCCITGLGIKELLVASHISSWAEDIANRLNPRNGLCLNAFHDRAFDRHLMWIDSDFRIRFTNRLKEYDEISRPTLDWLTGFEGKALYLPKQFSPDKELLRQHASLSSV